MATERQKIVSHFQDKKVKFPKPVDLAIALRKDQVGAKELKDSDEYTTKILKAGYTSPMFVQLFEDVNGTSKKVTTEAKAEEILEATEDAKAEEK